MPGGDRTGPRGMGAMTGRAAGYCTGCGMPGFATGWGRRGGRIGFGPGGGGYGRRNWFHATGVPGWRRSGVADPAMGYAAPYAPADAEAEKRALKRHADALRAELETIEQRLSGLEAAQKSV